MNQNSGTVSVIVAIFYFISHNLTRLIFLDKKLDMIESITGAIVAGIIAYLCYKYIIKKWLKL